MKRPLIIMLALVILACAVTPAMAENETVFSYDFDFFFHLNPAVFPEASQNRMKGYADLLDMLEIRGTWVYCEEYQSLDSEFHIIPVTQPAASLSFRIYGFLSHLLLSSPLLGNQTVLFNNEALMEFCLKTHEHLGLPVPYLALLHPYTFYNAFYYAVKAWETEIGAADAGSTISAKRLQAVAKEWERLLADDNALLDWFTALSLESDQQETMLAELYSVPSYLTETLTKGKGIKITGKNDEKIWQAAGQELLRQIERPGYFLFETSFPQTDSGYQPAARIERTEKEETSHLSLLLSYASENNEADNLLTLNLDAALPAAMPADAVCESTVKLSGVLLPNFDLTAVLLTGASGNFTLSVSEASGENAGQEAFSVNGTLIPHPNAPAPWYEIGDLIQFMNIFSVNDVTLQEFVHQIARPAVTGMLAFLVEVPASACQSVMDDLTDFGVLSVILGD